MPVTLPIHLFVSVKQKDDMYSGQGGYIKNSKFRHVFLSKSLFIDSYLIFGNLLLGRQTIEWVFWSADQVCYENLKSFSLV